MKCIKLSIILFLLVTVVRAQSPVVSEVLKVGTNEKLVFSYVAKGTQNYEAQIDPTNPNQAKWVFIEPVANLYDDETGACIITHYKGPTWKHTADGSTVKGKMIATMAAPNPSENIPWLLLESIENEGTGLLSNINRIQRLSTQGGVAPTTAPSLDKVGTVIKIPYTAVYYFFKNTNNE